MWHFYSAFLCSTHPGPWHSPSHKDAWDLSSEGLSHLSAAHVGDTVQSQTHEGGVSAGQVILDGIVNQPNQFAVAVHQHRDEKITLEYRQRGREWKGKKEKYADGWIHKCFPFFARTHKKSDICEASINLGVSKYTVSMKTTFLRDCYRQTGFEGQSWKLCG